MQHAGLSLLTEQQKKSLIGHYQYTFVVLCVVEKQGTLTSVICNNCNYCTFLTQIENKIFLKDDSAPEIGTTTATINRTGKTNAKKGVDDYNAYRDFHDREVEGHILAAFMVFCGMENMEGVFFLICYYLR